MIESELIIKESKTPWFNRIAFSMLFTAYIALVFYVFKCVATERMPPFDINKVMFYLVFLLAILVFYVLPIVTRNYVHLNFSELKIKYSYSIGVFNYEGKWKPLEDLNYISVFNNNDIYEINLWFKKNKNLNLFALEDFDEVIEKAFYLSEKLHIDLLDARKRGYHKWVDKKIYRETGEVEYFD